MEGDKKYMSGCIFSGQEVFGNLWASHEIKNNIRSGALTRFPK